MGLSRNPIPGTRYLRPSGNDDQPQLQAALDAAAAGSKREIVVDGYLNLASGVTYGGGNNGLILRGTSKWTSGLRAAAGAETAVLLTLGDGTASYNGHQTVRDLAFKSAVAKTGGAALSINSGGESAKVENCSILNTYDGIRLTGGAAQVQIVGNDIYLYDSGMRDGIRIDYTGTLGYGTEAWIVDNAMYGQHGIVNSAAGINVLNGDALHCRGNSVVAFGTNLQIIPNQTHSPETGYYLISDNIFSDAYGVGNVVINGATYALGKIQFTANHFAYANIVSPSGGCVVTGSNLEAVRFSGCFFGQNAGPGLTIGSGAQRISVQDCVFNANYQYGIDIASGVSGFQIIGNTCTNDNLGGGTALSQDYGIRYGGSHSNAIVALNDLRGNAVAATSGTAPSTNSYVAGNIS